MILDAQGIALATRCLWSLQEAAPEIEALLFTRVDGLTLTSTLDGGDGTQRLAAVSTALFLLGEQAAEVWRSGEAMEVQMVLTRAGGAVRYVTIKPVGYQAILTAMHSMNARYQFLKADLDLASLYLRSLLAGDTPPPPVNWQSR
jgi:predicted regulator of Ras-like GTPase activity (Roadblock/LC7/MglB family)